MKEKPTKSDLKRIDGLADEDIDYTDIPAFDDDFLRDVDMRVSPGKKPVTIRLDVDVLNWLKAQGRGYQSRINAVLRAYYEAQTKS